MCLECNNSKFNNRIFLQSDGTAQGPHMSCSYSDIAMAKYDQKAMSYNLKPNIWKRFRDDVFVIWAHGSNTLPSFLEYLNCIDETGKIQFTMEVNNDNSLEFLDLKLGFSNGKISTDVYAKATNSFTYVLPSTCYPMRNINNIPKGIALRLRRICDSDEKFTVRTSEYESYLISRDYNPGLVHKQFKKSRSRNQEHAKNYS